MKLFGTLITILTLLSLSCGKKKSEREVILFDLKDNAYQKYLNQKETPTKPDLSKDTYIKNDDYQFEIAMYKDGKFYYNLPTLKDGSGIGTWKKNGRIIEFTAERKLFDMYMELHPEDEEAKTTILKFRDSKDFHELPMTRVNAK